VRLDFTVLTIAMAQPISMDAAQPIASDTFGFVHGLPPALAT
jgi:hypothetical protein